MTLGSRIPTPIVALLLSAVVFAVAVVLLSSSRGDAPAAAATASGPRSLDATIAAATARLADQPNDVGALNALATASVDKLRDGGDGAFAEQAERSARRALDLDPRSFVAMDVLGSLALSAHRFEEGLAWSRRSLAAAPTRVAPLGIAGDALLELGRYPDAFDTIQRRLELRPDLPAYSRASYALELRGERRAAISLMERAVEAGAPGGEAQTWARVQLGLLRLGGGDLAGARADMRAALAARPADARANAGMARVLAAQGDLAAAAGRYQRALTAAAVPEYASGLGWVQRAMGDVETSRDNLRRAIALEEESAAAGSDVGLELALLRADIRRPTGADIAAARRARASRPSVIGDQVLGWTLTRAGRCAEADRWATRSLRLGTRDATMLFHAGMAAGCAGRPGVARERLSAALALNPAFSVRWAPVAREKLAALS